MPDFTIKTNQQRSLWAISKKICILPIWALLLCFGFTAYAQKNKDIVIVIDPGHGGKDPGKISSSKKYDHEKEINLEVALLLGDYLENRLKGVKVVYTRTTDMFVSLEDRVNLANSIKADYFISLHCNSNPNPSVYGTKTHIHSHRFKASKQLALRLEKEFETRAGRKSRGIQSSYDRGENLYVLQYSEMPGVLVEIGFLSNPTEERYLNSEKGQDYMASAIFRSFRDFLETKHNKNLASNRTDIYRVQIMASPVPINLECRDFKKLGMKVEEHVVKTSAYKYKYVVGREYSKAEAQKLARKVQALGVKDAFVIKVN